MVVANEVVGYMEKLVLWINPTIIVLLKLLPFSCANFASQVYWKTSFVPKL